LIGGVGVGAVADGVDPREAVVGVAGRAVVGDHVAAVGVFDLGQADVLGNAAGRAVVVGVIDREGVGCHR